MGAPGHILFFEPGGSYRVEHPNHAGDECTVFSIPIDTLDTLAQSHGFSFRDNGSHLFHQLSCLSSKDIHILHGDLLRALQGEQGDSLCVEDLALCLIGKAVLLSRQAERSISSQRESTRRANTDSVQAALIFMHMQMHRRVTLADVARAAHVSPYHLCRIFRRHTGLSIHAYLNQIRLRSALFDLDIGAASLTEVALNYGFDSHSHFSSSFKRQFGTPPASYRSARSQRQLSKQ